MTAPTFDPGPCKGLSAFQRQHILSLAARPEFAHFVLVDGDPAKTFQRPAPGPVNVLWYDNGRTLRLHRIGVGKLLRTVECGLPEGQS